MITSRSRRCIPGCELLETRIQLSSVVPAMTQSFYPVDFVGPIPPDELGPIVQPMQWVSGITLSFATPTLGRGVLATLSVDNFGGFMIAGTT
ncbi:hypothetical protein [Paludisphaera soli]|uniref:hypothetical protein n=1 Tax=Paludisphaera soli TaxID=2712865 RepID=UPI0013ED4513|nr:hypothetical protein [Paludisphaera soli]